MKRTLGVCVLSLISVFGLAAPRTIRVDYYHTGNAQQQTFSLDRTVLEPLQWPGNPAKAIDESGLGNYRFEVRDKQGGKLLYSRGFNSAFAEWQDTEEARHASRTFSESLRFPPRMGRWRWCCKGGKAAAFRRSGGRSSTPGISSWTARGRLPPER